MNLNQFIGPSQLSAMKSACRGEEGQYFRDMIADLKETIAGMPSTYETEDIPAEMKKATLHYFKGGSDWYIIERDMGCPDDIIKGTQQQAYGFACLNGDTENAEFGYICIAELIENNVELDLYYKPELVEDIKKRFGHCSDDTTDDLGEYMDEGQCPTVAGCCTVELDGRCCHGSPSVVMAAGLV
jgi:hypothetical protein